MDKVKKVIIILIILLLIIALLIIGLINCQININSQGNKVDVEKVTYTGFSIVEDYDTYYTVKEIVNNYIMYMKQINGDQYIETGKLNMSEKEIRDTLQNEGIKAIKGILDQQYIQDLSINEDTIKLKQNKYKQNGNYDKEIIYNLDIEDIVETDIGENIAIVLVTSKLDNKELQMIIKLDKSNNTYSIFLEDYIEKYNYNENMNREDININTDKIKSNSYNSHINVEASETYILSQYFSEYRIKMINDTKNAYGLLNEEYREKKYGSYESFETYINNNKEKILYTSINKYQITEYDGLKEYICIDKNGKYYIFREKSITDYEVILDTYTVDLLEFLEEYNSNENEIKSGMNIRKIFDAINDVDYNYVYTKLDNTFKQNNFPNKESFEKYVEKYFLNNQLAYDNCEKSGELYIYDITVTEGIESNKNAVNKTFIIKLLEGTDFVFSFNVK